MMPIKHFILFDNKPHFQFVQILPYTIGYTIPNLYFQGTFVGVRLEILDINTMHMGNYNAFELRLANKEVEA